MFTTTPRTDPRSAAFDYASAMFKRQMEEIMTADGQEQAECEREEAAEREFDELEMDEQLAEESRDDLWCVPVRCVVHGHIGLGACWHCGCPR